MPGVSCHLGPELQGQTLARSVFPVQQVSRVASRQAVRIESGQNLLRQLLRLAVRLEMRRVRRDLQGR